MRSFARYFLNGLLLVAPAGVTLYICWLVFVTVDGWLNLSIPGAGFLATVALITALGFIAKNYLAQQVLDWIDATLNRLPLVRLVYTALRDLTDALVGKRKRFDQPVLVSLTPDRRVRVLGFVTREVAGPLGVDGHVAVYLPQSYNFAGQTIVVPRDAIERLQLASSEVMTFVVSGGVAGFGAQSDLRDG